MELDRLHQEVDEKLLKIEAEIERFQSNIKSCDDPEQRVLLEKDLATLETIRDKLIKAKQITRNVTDLRDRVENPPPADDRIAGVPRWFFYLIMAAATGVAVWWATSI